MNTKTDPTLAAFETHRPRLFAIAYRMLGTIADAEDMVQETFLRWQKSPREKVLCAEAWLSTVVTRLSINQLKSARVQREHYVGPWLPEPLVEDESSNPRASAERKDSLSMAFLVILETLSPTERAVYLLREVFAYDFPEVARIVEKSEASCRKLLSRAREHVTGRRPRFKSSPRQQQRLLDEFLRAAATGDAQGFAALLAQDVEFISDGGAEARALRRPLRGLDGVLRVLVHEAPRQEPIITSRRRLTINGQPGFVAYVGNRPHVAMLFDVDGDRIRTIYLVTNPKKLAHLPPPFPGAN
jgi:RNA polymerase sigma-70 factor (ECF subfamily)